MKKLIFFNNLHNGDIHYTRSFIIDIMKKTNFDEYVFNHMNSINLLKDIKNLSYMPYVVNNRYNDNTQVIESVNNTIINTWVGQQNAKYIKMTQKSCSLYTNYEIYKDIFKYLDVDIEDIGYYIPKIIWDNININKIIEFDNKNNNKKVLISNGMVLSGQSPQFPFDSIINDLSNHFTNVDFILTHKINIKKSNIFFTSDIINQSDCDLNEIAYLSTKCNIVVGRASGPFAFCHNYDNFNDANKTLISFTHNKHDSNWYDDVECNQVWSNNFQLKNIYNVIKKEISKL